jgi:hypothetical protein
MPHQAGKITQTFCRAEQDAAAISSRQHLLQSPEPLQALPVIDPCDGKIPFHVWAPAAFGNQWFEDVVVMADWNGPLRKASNPKRLYGDRWGSAGGDVSNQAAGRCRLRQTKMSMAKCIDHGPTSPSTIR